MSFLRRLSTRRLLAVIGGAVAVVIGGTAIAIAATSGTSVPPKEPLPVAVHQALAAKEQTGVTARITFTNHLIDSSSIPGGGPIVSGASGRLWATNDGQARLELQSDSGDMEILLNDRVISVYDVKSKTLYKATLPAEKGAKAEPEHGVPSIATIKRALAHLGTGATLSGATPTSIAGRGAYAVKVSPRHSAGLVGAAQLAWDAATGTPLSIGVYATGQSDPVLQLKATDISYGPVDASAFDVQPPAGTKTVDLTPQLRQLAAKHQAGSTAKAAGKKAHAVSGLKAVTKAAGFDVSAPATLAGLPRKGVRLITVDGQQGAVVGYGKGLGGILVLEHPTGAATAGEKDPLAALPAVSIGGATGHELATALGTVLTFDRAGVSYTVLGSVPPAAAEAAARGL